MYAIIKSGGKQYRVEKDDIIEVELLGAELGSQVEFKEVLFAYDGSEAQFGEPHLANFIVTGEFVGEAKGPKLTSMKYKASHHQYRKFGHRQHYARVKILEIGSHKKEHKKEHKAKDHKEHKEHKEHKAEHKEEHKEHKHKVKEREARHGA